MSGLKTNGARAQENKLRPGSTPRVVISGGGVGVGGSVIGSVGGGVRGNTDSGLVGSSGSSLQHRST